MKIEITPDDKKDLRAFDQTMLVAINTCPVWGLVRYQLGKTFSAQSRSMPLEAGAASHEFYAATRLFQLGFVQGYMDHMKHHGIRLFGEDRFEAMMEHVKDCEYKQRDWKLKALR